MTTSQRRVLAYVAPHQPLPAHDAALQRQVEVVHNWWTSLPHEHHEVLTEVWEPGKCSIAALNDLGERLAKVPADAVVCLYITGYGLEGRTSRNFRLHVDGGTYNIVNLMERIMASDAGHAMVVVDACYAYQVSNDLSGVYGDAVRDSNSEPPPPIVVLVTGTADAPYDEPRYEEFAGILQQALEQLKQDIYKVPSTDEFLTPDKLIQVMRDVRDKRAETEPFLVQPDIVIPRDGRNPSPALPNPAYDPQHALTSPATRDLAFSAATIDEYWVAKATGAPTGDPGWYFTGRGPVMEQVVTWLAGDGRLLVVAGARGSGKSAILGRTVVLADAGFRVDPRYRDRVEKIPTELVPGSGSVDVAIDARGRDSNRICDLILEAIGQTGAVRVPDAIDGVDQKATTERSVRERLAAGLLAAAGLAGHPICVVVDAIDESVNPTALVMDVVLALSDTVRRTGEPVSRVIIGVRDDENNPDLLELIPSKHRVVVRTDEDAPDEIRAYCRELLTRPGSPYAEPGAEEAVEAVAEMLAAQNPPNFLDTRIIAEALSTATQIADIEVLRERGLGSILPDQLASALVAQAGQTGRSVTDYLAVLRALAFARGAGTPWGRVWPAIASAVADREIDDEAISQTLAGPLGVFVMTGSENHERVFRLSHGAITDLLLTEPAKALGVRP